MGTQSDSKVWWQCSAWHEVGEGSHTLMSRLMPDQACATLIMWATLLRRQARLWRLQQTATRQQTLWCGPEQVPQEEVRRREAAAKEQATALKQEQHKLGTWETDLAHMRSIGDRALVEGV